MGGSLSDKDKGSIESNRALPNSVHICTHISMLFVIFCDIKYCLASSLNTTDEIIETFDRD